MEITKTLEFNSEEVKTITHFRERIFHPMCDIFLNRCQICPFNKSCSDLEEFFDKVITDRQWFVPKNNE